MLVETILDTAFIRECGRGPQGCLSRNLEKTGPSAFRRIYLFDTMEKIVQSILLNRIHKEIEEKHALSDNEHDFRKIRSIIGIQKSSEPS